MEKILEDYRKEGFTRREWMVYGWGTTVAVFGLLLFASWVESL